MNLLLPSFRQGRAPLRLIRAMSIILLAMCRVAHPQGAAFSVKDDIAMARFSDPSAEKSPWAGNDAKLSPDGRYFAVVITRGLLPSDQIQSTIEVFDSGRVRTFLNRTSDPEPAPRIVAQIATVPHFEETVPYAPVIKDMRWAKAGERLFFRGEAANGAWQLYQADIVGARPKPLTSPKYNVDRFDVAGNTIVYVASVYGAKSSPQGIVINQDALDVTGYPLIDILFPGQMPTYIPETFSLYVLHLNQRSGKAGSVPGYSVPEISLLLHYLPFQLSPDGRRLILTVPAATIPSSWEKYDPPARFEHRRLQHDDSSLTSPDNVLRPRVYSVVDLTSGKVTPLIDAPNAQNLGYYAANNRAAWSADGHRVLLTNVFLPLKADNRGTAKLEAKPCAVASVDLPSLTWRCLFLESSDPSDHSMDVDDVSFAAGGDHVQVFIKRETGTPIARQYELRDGVWVLGESAASDLVEEPAGVPRHISSKASSIRVFIRQSLNIPPTLWASDSDTGKEREIWDPNPQLQSLRLGAGSVIHWKDHEGREWTAGLIKPVGYVPGKRYPLVIQMYEFDETKFLTDGTDPTAFAARELASNGFVVLQIRKQIVTLSDQDAQIHLEAYRSAIENLSQVGLIDPSRVGVVGFSWTCWYVVNALVKAPRLFAAATIAEGFDNSYMQYMLFGPGPPNTRDQMEQVRGSSPFGAGLARWVRDAPDFHLDGVETPLRIEAMKPATILNEWELYAGLSLQHKPVDMIYFPKGTHIHQRPLERLESQQGNIDWMRFWLQDYVDPAPEKKAQYILWRKLKAETKVDDGAQIALEDERRPSPPSSN
jgi:dipeptidyl aminopeptidase/acylaminoacyl peptidase